MPQLSFFPAEPQTIINVPTVINAPKFEPAMEVINKILNVKKSNTARLSAADITELNRYQDWFNEQNGKLDRWEMLFKFELESQYPGNWKIEKSRWGSISLTVDQPLSENEFLDHEFNPEDAIVAITDQRDGLQKAFVFHILAYLKETYQLDRFDDTDEIERMAKTIYTYEPVIDYVFSIVPHASLNDAAVSAMIKKFYSLIYGKTTATLDKNKIQFPKLSFYRFERSNDDFMNFFTVLGYFETGQVDAPLFGKEIVIGSYKQSQTYQLGGAKITSVRFYQNGKAILYFADEIQANKFYNLF